MTLKSQVKPIDDILALVIKRNNEIFRNGVSPEVLLMIAVIKRAYDDVKSPTFGLPRHIAREARAWLYDDDIYEMSFRWCLEKITDDTDNLANIIRKQLELD